MIRSAAEDERAACKDAGGGILECSAHLVEWRLRRKWIGGLSAAGSLLVALVLVYSDQITWE